jgi:hypothetical protein
MVGLEDRHGGGRPGVEASPDLGRVLGRRQRIEECDLASRFNARRRDDRIPPRAGPPVGILEAPDPESRLDVPELGH